MLLENKGAIALSYVLMGSNFAASAVFTLAPGKTQAIGEADRIYFYALPRVEKDRTAFPGINWERIAVTENKDVQIQFDTNFNGDAWLVHKMAMSREGEVEWDVQRVSGALLDLSDAKPSTESNIVTFGNFQGLIRSDDPGFKLLTTRVLIRNRSASWPLHFESDERKTLAAGKDVSLSFINVETESDTNPFNALADIRIFVSEAKGWIDLPITRGKDVTIEVSPNGKEWRYKMVDFDEQTWQLSQPEPGDGEPPVQPAF